MAGKTSSAPSTPPAASITVFSLNPSPETRRLPTDSPDEPQLFRHIRKPQQENPLDRVAESTTPSVNDVSPIAATATKLEMSPTLRTFSVTSILRVMLT